ncbi:hypothetical protein HK101_003443, partial [Irineochytrium annulatum]
MFQDRPYHGGGLGYPGMSQDRTRTSPTPSGDSGASHRTSSHAGGPSSTPGSPASSGGSLGKQIPQRVASLADRPVVVVVQTTDKAPSYQTSMRASHGPHPFSRNDHSDSNAVQATSPPISPITLYDSGARGMRPFIPGPQSPTSPGGSSSGVTMSARSRSNPSSAGGLGFTPGQLQLRLQQQNSAAGAGSVANRSSAGRGHARGLSQDVSAWATPAELSNLRQTASLQRPGSAQKEKAMVELPPYAAPDYNDLRSRSAGGSSSEREEKVPEPKLPAYNLSQWLYTSQVGSSSGSEALPQLAPTPRSEKAPLSPTDDAGHSGARYGLQVMSLEVGQRTDGAERTGIEKPPLSPDPSDAGDHLRIMSQEVPVGKGAGSGAGRTSIDEKPPLPRDGEDFLRVMSHTVTSIPSPPAAALPLPVVMVERRQEGVNGGPAAPERNEYLG